MSIRFCVSVLVIAVAVAPAFTQEKQAKVAIDSADAVKLVQKGLHDLAAAKTNPTDAAFLLRTRIDAISYKDAAKKEIEVTGVRLDFSGYAKETENWNDVVPAAINALIQKHIAIDSGAKLTADVAKGFANIELPDQPHVQLQAAANKKNLDDVYLASSSFNAAGELQIDGMISKGMNRQEFEKALRAELDGKPAVRAKTGPFANADRVSFSGIKEADWTLGRAALQAWLAGQSKDGLDQFRIDRVEYSYQQPGEKTDKIIRLFVRIKLIELTGDAKTDINIHEKLSDQILGKNWEAFTKPLASVPAALRREPIVDKPDRTTVKYADERVKLQAAIASRTDIDGTLVWGKARFDSTGKLEPKGVWRGAKDEESRHREDLETRIKAELAKQNPTLAAGGVSAVKLASVDTQGVLAELGDWTAATLDDVRVERIYFDPAGKLTLKATAASKEDGAKLDAQFRVLLGRYEILKKLDESRMAVVSAEPPVEKIAPVEVGANIAAFTSSLTTDLQKFLADHAREDKYRGILIGRGYFDRRQGNRYSLNVIVDERKQEAAVRDLVKDFAAKPAYAGYLGKDENPILSVEEISLRKLVGQLREVMPAYPLFDGFRVDDAVHDAQRNLVLIVAGVGTPDPLEPKAKEKDPIGDVRQTLKKMLDDHPVWRKRSAVRADSRLVVEYGSPSGPVSFNYDLGPLTAIHGTRAVFTDRGEMRAQVRTALMHNPNNSTLWYLSAAFNILDKREDLAMRDLRRVVLLEKEPEIYDFAVEAKKARIQVLEPFQGTMRHRVEDLLDKAFLDYHANKPPPGLR